MRGKEKEGFKPQRGRGEAMPCPSTVSGNHPSASSGARRPRPVDEESAGASPYRYWNEDALSRWLGTENLGWAILDGIRTRVLVDNGARVNSVMPAYVLQHILGTPTINRVVQSMKESEMHNTPMEWQTARVIYEWAQGFQFHRPSLGERLKFPTNTAEDPLDLDEKVLLTDKCTIPGFQSVVAHGRTQRTMMFNRLNVMTQAPYPEDKADLPNGLYIMRTYTELKDGSRNVSLVLRNLTA